MSLSSHFPEAQKLALRLEHDLAILEGGSGQDAAGAGGYGPGSRGGIGGHGATGGDHGGAASLAPAEIDALERSVSAAVDELGRRIQSLENLVHREPPNRREVWRSRVERLAQDFYGFRASVERHWQRMSQSERERRIRSELFDGRTSEDSSGSSAVDAYLKEAESLERSKNYVNSLKEYGTSVLKQMDEQGDLLKSARRKVWDVANTLGLSNSLMKIIQRRERGDKWLVYGGMLVTTSVLAGLWWFYLRASPPPPAGE